jgi:ribosomal protein S19E (S16A)
LGNFWRERVEVFDLKKQANQKIMQNQVKGREWAGGLKEGNKRKNPNPMDWWVMSGRGIKVEASCRLGGPR